MSSILSTIWLCLLLAALIGWLVGWLLGRLSRSRPAESLDAELAGKLRLCDDERMRMQVEIANLKTKINTLETEAREHQTLRSQLNAATNDLSAATAAMGERNALRDEVDELKQKLRVFESVPKNGDGASSELESAKHRLSAFESTLADRDATIAQLRNRVLELEWLKWNLKNIVFPVDSYEIIPSQKAVLEEVVPILKRLKNVMVEIGGHTDNVDSEEHNRELSMQRADGVRNYLIARGAASDMLIAAGYGASRPIADNGTDEGRQANRRIEFVVRR